MLFSRFFFKISQESLRIEFIKILAFEYYRACVGWVVSLGVSSVGNGSGLGWVWHRLGVALVPLKVACRVGAGGGSLRVCISSVCCAFLTVSETLGGRRLNRSN